MYLSRRYRAPLNGSRGWFKRDLFQKQSQATNFPELSIVQRLRFFFTQDHCVSQHSSEVFALKGGYTWSPCLGILGQVVGTWGASLQRPSLRLLFWYAYHIWLVECKDPELYTCDSILFSCCDYFFANNKPRKA